MYAFDGKLKVNRRIVQYFNEIHKENYCSEIVQLGEMYHQKYIKNSFLEKYLGKNIKNFKNIVINRNCNIEYENPQKYLNSLQCAIV